MKSSLLAWYVQGGIFYYAEFLTAFLAERNILPAEIQKKPCGTLIGF